MMEKRKTRKLPKRILAWMVCFAMAFSVLTIMPDGTIKVQAASADGAKIATIAKSYMGKEQSVGRCLGFCRLVWREAGYNTAQDPNGCTSFCAYHSWTVSSHLGSTSKDNIPLGALVFFSGASSQSALPCGARPGHVGIYVGDGYIVNARGTVTNGTNIKKDKISLWESWGYAFLGWRPISGYTLDSGGSDVNSFISYVERPASGGNYSDPIQILGYALHKNGIRNVTAWVNGQVMDCPMYNSPDVAEVYPGYPTGNEGFQAQIPISCLKEGENEIDIYAYEFNDWPHNIASCKFNYVLDKEASTSYTYKLNDDTTTITITKCTSSDENIGIPSTIDGHTVTGIEEKAFQNVTSMKTVSFPSTLKSIGNYAFAGCTSLTAVTLPDSLTNLGTYVFGGCTSLKSAKLNVGQINVTEGLFQGCTALSSVTLPNLVQYIREYAFSGCASLKNLSLPKSLSTVYANVFLNSGISKINYAGTSTNWKNVVIFATGNAKFLNTTVTGSNGKSFSANKSKWNTSSPAPVKKPTVSKVKSFKAKAAKKKLTLTWKQLSGAAGYQIQISTKKKFKGAKTISISKSKKTYTKKSLKAKKKYYLRIRAYKTYKDVNKKTDKVYGKWSTINKKTK